MSAQLRLNAWTLHLLFPIAQAEEKTHRKTQIGRTIIYVVAKKYLHIEVCYTMTYDIAHLNDLLFSSELLSLSVNFHIYGGIFSIKSILLTNLLMQFIF